MITAAYLRERGTVRSGQRDLDAPPAASAPHAMFTRRRCCPTARCWSQEDIAAAALSPARNCTIRPAGPGLPPAASSLHAIFTRRRCCPTARCSSQEALTAALSRQRGTVRPGQRDLDRHRQPQHRTLLITRRRCCPTARCWWQGELTAALVLAARNCTTRPPGPGRATGSLDTARYLHTATLLPNGKVLVAGGDRQQRLSYAARSCTTRPAGPGPPPAASPPHAT